MDELPDAVQKLVKGARVKYFPKGQIIQYVGDLVSEVFIVKSGVVKIYDIDDDGNEKVLHLVKAPSLIPFAFFSGEQATTKWFYGALTGSELYVLEHDVIRKAMKEDALLAVGLMQGFSADVHELLVRLSSLGKTNAQDKVLAALRFLLVCHAKQRPSGWWRVPFPVNHQLLGDMVGVTRESVAVVMKQLQNKKIVRNPRITILEINKEKLLAEK